MSSTLDLDGDPSRLFELEPGNTVTLNCLMPNGILIPLTVYKDASLRTIKERLWDEARKYPLANILQSRESCVFVCITDCAEQEELDDETRCVGDVKPFSAVLKVKWKEQQGRTNEHVLDSRISHLIGKGIHELNTMSDNELQDFRAKMKKKCEEIAGERDARATGILPQLLNCPPDMCDFELDEACLSKLSHNDRNGPKILYAVSVPVGDSTSQYANLRFLLPVDTTADELIRQVLVKRRENFDKSVHVQSSGYMLKVCGREEYLLHPAGHHRPLHHFHYVRSRIMKDEIPQLVLVERPPCPAPRRDRQSIGGAPRPAPRPIPSGKRELCLWEVAQNYYLTVVSLHRVNVEDGAVVRLQVGLYHGNETLCDIMETSEAVVASNEAHFNEKLVFGIPVYDLPRMTKLSAVLLLVRGGSNSAVAAAAASKSKSKKQRGVEGAVVLACMTFMALDYKGVLIRGEKPFYMWPAETVRVDDNILSPTGAPPSSPHAAYGATTVRMKLADYGIDPNLSVTYPTLSRILECAAQQRPAQTQSQTFGFDRDALSSLLQRDPLQTFHEQEKEIIWQSREDIRYEFPECLPKLLSCLRWNAHTDVAQMYALLQIWPQLSVDVSLELLDFLYPDKRVREFAVDCLKKSMSDSELYRYLLQLVQAIKFEPYSDSDLVNFLLERALSNRRIGHAFFWLLRAEMHRPSVSTRFGTILEAYFHGAQDHMKHLRKQLDALGKMQNINNLIKTDQYKKVRDRGIADMRTLLSEQAYVDVLSDLSSPHDPTVKLGLLSIDKCKYMDSKMKPLLLAWSNADPTGTDIYLIFKHGDDLRQDMLTLQMIAIMDSIWLSSGLDLRMSPYGCLSTGRRAGLIEVVQNAETIANIQKRNAGATLQSAFKRESLYLWLKTHNPTPESLKKAVEEFRLSCAGYCVVTYVLGIGDRHSDNIMLKKNGQLFHIDFGHFLGNFKSKFGVKRERVPFVLTNDFVYIINGGRANSDSRDSPFQRFKETCEKAFKLLRQRGSLIIALFMMMLSTGIPELQSVNDIKYLQDTLVLHLSEEDALKHFENKFNEALKNSWKTSVNWAVHNVARDNV